LRQQVLALQIITAIRVVIVLKNPAVAKTAVRAVNVLKNPAVAKTAVRAVNVLNTITNTATVPRMAKSARLADNY